ncbi:MAG: M48 family metalloprotease [Ignavibacteriae bacterium]|nr:M48 family metalloprotease [Ignavibacteriota bacterium]
MKRFLQLRYFIFTVTLLFVIGCGVALNMYTDSDEIKLGQQLDEQIKSNPKEYPILQGRPEVKQYVMGIGNQVLASSEVKKRGVYAYQYEIIHDDKTINAFCTPGGYIYVYTGLLKFLDNESALAGVLGHEIAHAERKHATNRMTKAYGIQFILAIALGEKPSQLVEIGANLFSGLALLANSRADETESDEYSMKYLSSTKYYPGGVTYFFEKIQKEQGRSGGAFERLLSTHPLPQDRVDHVNELLRNMGNPQPTENNTFSKSYKEFKKKLP